MTPSSEVRLVALTKTFRRTVAVDAVSAEIDDLAAMREPSGSPADILRERREQRRRRGETVAIDHSVARRTKLHG